MYFFVEKHAFCKFYWVLLQCPFSEADDVVKQHPEFMPDFSPHISPSPHTFLQAYLKVVEGALKLVAESTFFRRILLFIGVVLCALSNSFSLFGIVLSFMKDYLICANSKKTFIFARCFLWCCLWSCILQYPIFILRIFW